MEGQEDYNLGGSDVLDRRFDGYLPPVRDSEHLAQDSILPMKLYCSNKACAKYLYNNGDISLGTCFLIQELNEDRKCGYLYFVTAAHNLYCTFCENYRWVKPILRWTAGQRQADDFLLGADDRGVSKSSFYGWLKVSDGYIHRISKKQNSKECYPFDYGILAVRIAGIKQATTYATKMRKLGMFAAPPKRHDLVELAYLCGYPGEVCNKSSKVPPQGVPADPDDLQYLGPEPMVGGYYKWKVTGGRFWMSPKRSLPAQKATGTLKPSERREEERRTAALYPLPQRHERDICEKQDSELNKARLYRHYIDSSQGQSGSPVYLFKVEDDDDDQQCVAMGIHVGLWEDDKGEVKRMGFNVAVRLHGDVLCEMKRWVSDPRNKAKDQSEPDVDIREGTEEFLMAWRPATFFGRNMAAPGAAAQDRQDDASAVKDTSPASREHAGVETTNQQDTALHIADSKSGSNSTHLHTPQGREGQSIQQNPLATRSTQSAAPEPSIGVRQIEQQIPQATTTNSMCEFCEENPAIWSCQQCVGALLCQACDSKLHKKEARAKHIRQLLSGVQNQKTLSQAAITQLQLHAEPTISLQELLKRSIPGAPFKIVQLMTLNFDPQDAGSFSQNTLVSEGAVRELLAQRGHRLRHWLGSDSPKGQSVTTIGLYGNIALIREWLCNICVLQEPDARHLMTDSEPGILCISNGTEVQFLVLIPPAHSFEYVNSTNPCCNLVRYLQELSDNMVTFFSESELKMFSSTPFALTNVQRTISRRTISRTAAVERLPERLPNYLDYLYYGYEKFCLTPCLSTGQLKVFLHCVLADSTQQMGMTPQEYLSELFNNLQKHTCKNVQRAYPFQEMVQVTRFSESVDQRFGQQSMPMTDWLRRLICLVPIQIARIESGYFQIFVNGINTGEIIGKETLDVIDKIKFGLYEGVLKDWTGPVKVLTSMGKQSTGRSYMLNHLTGSLFDVSGGRCTDGIWMTVQQTEECLYVVLDFEGLGPRERGDEDDVLLSVVNAAISGLTIFKVDSRFDTDFEETLKRIQIGVDWIREDVSSDKLLRGSIVLNIKDVAADGVEDVQYHFDKMISTMCQDDPDNFVTKMYKERYHIQAMPPFRTDQYQRELHRIANWLRDVKTPTFQSGSDFVEIMKMLMAKVYKKDWLPFDQTMVQIRVERIKKQLDLAVEKGQGSINSEPGSLSLASGESVADEEITAAGGLIFPGLPDEGLCLPTGTAPETSWALPLAYLAQRFSSVFGKKRNERDLNNAKRWTNGFQDFLHAVFGRRKARITMWQESYFRPKENSKFVVGLRRDIDTRMENMEKQLELCRDLECHHCHYPCLLPKYHTSLHSCFGNHRCYIACYHCCDTANGMLEEPKGSTAWPDVNEQEGMKSLRLALDTASVFPIHVPKGRIDSSWQCREVAGHADKHNCKIRKHTCGKECHLIRWDKCAKTCKLPHRHPKSQHHECVSENHICVGVCDLDGCTARCTVSYTGKSHVHFCGVNRCQKECDFPGCKEKCKDQDHFHGTNGPAVRHFCTKPYHVCVEECSKDGLCMVMGKLDQTKASKTKTAHTGQVITYDWYQTYNGAKVQCRVRIKSGYMSHKGKHDCKQPRHTCKRTCANCGYYCKEEIGHTGGCRVPHGNMRRTMAIIPGGGTFRVGGHEFTESDTGESEVCDLYCQRMGRGHTHFRFCKDPIGRSQCGDLAGIRHVDQIIGPDEFRPKDECTHEAFWREQDIVDPCPNYDFNKCPYPCRLPGPHGRACTSYCSMPLWHAAATESEVRTATAGHFDNGHHLMCEHVGYEPIHHILVLSRSDSMSTGDHKPDSDSEYYSSHPNRLGAVLDASLHYLHARWRFGTKDIVSAVGFYSTAVEIFSGHRLDPESLVKLLADKLKPGGGTDYSKAIDLADVLLKRNETYDTIVRNAVIIFLSDGQCNTNLEKTIPSLERLLQGRHDRKKSPVRLHTVKFGRDERGNDLLKKMADMAKFRHSHHFSMQSSFEHKVSSIYLTVDYESIAGTLNGAGFMPVCS